MSFRYAGLRAVEALRKAFRKNGSGPSQVVSLNPSSQLLTALEESGDVVFVTDRDGRLTYVNAAFESTYGLARDQALGQEMESTNGLRTNNHQKLWHRALASGQPHREEHVNVDAEGRSLNLASTVAPIVDERGRVTSLVSVQRDISDRSQLDRFQKVMHSVIDESVADSIVQGRLHTEKRRISLLNARFSNRGESFDGRRPEMLIKDLNLLFQETEPILLDYHAHLDKYLGDQIIAQFGVPVDYERHALMAVLAGLKIQERVERAGLPWEMSVSVASGECMVGMIGHERQSYTAVGAPARLASDIAQQCAPGTVTVGQVTFREVHRFVKGRRKTLFPFRRSDPPRYRARIWGLLQELDRVTNDVNLLKQVGLLFKEGSYFVAAHEHLMRALELDPNDQRIKLAYAETSLKLKKGKVKHEPSTIQLYEVLGIKNFLQDGERIPVALYQRFQGEVEGLLDYPEEWILPVEALDGSLGHSRAVGFLAYVLADALGLSQQEKAEVLEAGYLADLGKASVPHHILNRAGTLNDQEFKEIVKHPMATVRILEQKGFQNKQVLNLISASHERFNGSGYPHGLVGEEIPLGARILGVADTYAGLTAWRPYRNQWECKAACAEIKREAERGKFDPAVIEAFQRLMH